MSCGKNHEKHVCCCEKEAPMEKKYTDVDMSIAILNTKNILESELGKLRKENAQYQQLLSKTRDQMAELLTIAVTQENKITYLSNMITEFAATAMARFFFWRSQHAGLGVDISVLCPHCTNWSLDNAQFCHRCGKTLLSAPVSPAESTPMSEPSPF